MSYNQTKMLGAIDFTTLHYILWKVIYEKMNYAYVIQCCLDILIKHKVKAVIGHGSLNCILL